MERIGLIGVPLETVVIRDEMSIISSYIPGITDETRKLVLDRAEEQGILIEDLGEAYLGEYYDPGINIDRLHGIDWGFISHIKQRDMKKVEEVREFIIDMGKEFDLLVAIGPSHLGAIILYEEDDSVARFDYHADFTDWGKLTHFCYASYMDWVKENIKQIEIYNYFVKWSQCNSVLGENSKEPDDGHYANANHFDIDVDCFNTDLCIQNVYKHIEGPSEATPEDVELMIKEAKPRKLGIWEYRPQGDYNNNGLEFIVDAIRNAVRK